MYFHDYFNFLPIMKKIAISMNTYVTLYYP